MYLAATVFDHPSWTGAAVIAAKTAAVYVFLIVGLRVLGKRELGQMSLYDLVMVIILGNAVQNAMINNDNTLGGGIVAGVVLLGLNWALNRLVRRSKRVEGMLIGHAVLIVNDGRPIREHMAREGITMEQLDAALREHGMQSLDEVQLGVLETDGTISIVPRGSKVLRTRRHYRGIRLP
jgi:uncharacterized membrane protein YcaP (DUF421 family)